MIERYVGFYTYPRFWAGRAVDRATEIDATTTFAALMSHRVFTYREGVYTLCVCRDGLLMLHLPEIESKFMSSCEADRSIELQVWRWSEYVDHVNCLYLILDSCILRVMNLGYLELVSLPRQELYVVRVEDGKEIGGGRGRVNISGDQMMERYPSSHWLPFEAMTIGRHAFPSDVFDVLNQEFKVVAWDATLRQRLSTLAKSIGEYKVGNYSIALMLSWFVIESVLLEKWQDLLEEKNSTFNDGSKRIGGRRRDSLTKGREYTASVISNILELSDVLPFEIYKRINRARDNRNDVVHQDPRYKCRAEDCQEAIRLAQELATEGKQLDIRVNLSYSVLGP